jgi:lipopolysaccharide assembly outer membrane protein LptD (OstA)
MLISVVTTTVYGQQAKKDSLKTVSKVDTLPREPDELEAEVNYSAEDSVVADKMTGRVYLYGKSKVNYGGMNMEASVIEIDYDHNTILAYGLRDSSGKMMGAPVFKDGNETMEAEKILYNLKTKKGKIYNAMTRQGQMLVIGNEIKKDSNNVIYMRDMRCIPCEQKDARTMFRATRAKIIPNDKIVTGPMYVQVGGIPTPLGVPFGYFPNTKKAHNGILIPNPAFSQTQGFYLRNAGFYFAINDMTDVVLKGDIYTNGSFVADVRNNYNVRYKASGYTQLRFTQYNLGDKDVPSTFSKNKSLEAHWIYNQDSRSNPNQRFSSNVNYVSNQSVSRFSSSNSNQFLQNSFQSNINYSKTYKNSALTAAATLDQASQKRLMTVSLPNFVYSVNRFFPFKRENAVSQNVLDKIGMNYVMNAKNTLTGYDTTIFKTNIADSMKYGIQHSLPITTNFNLFKYITVTPGLNLSAVMLTRAVEKTYDAETNKVITKKTNTFVTTYDAYFSTAVNTKLYFDYQFLKGNLKQIRHVMIPTITYNYRPDLGYEKTGIWKQVQKDSLGNTAWYSVAEGALYSGPAMGKQNTMAFSLQNNIQAKLKQTTDTGVTYKKVTLLQGLTLNGNYNFAKDSMRMSGITMSANNFFFNKLINVVTTASYSPYQYDKVLGREVKAYLLETGQLARMTYADIKVSGSIGNSLVESLWRSMHNDMTNAAEKGSNKTLEENGTLPWNLSLAYSLTFYNKDARKLQPSHNVTMTADVMPTKFWKLGVSTGFDVPTHRFTYSRITLYRDLKCWEGHIDWIPFGVNKSYTLTINLKSAMLKDANLKRSKQFFDNFSQ